MTQERDATRKWPMQRMTLASAQACLQTLCRQNLSLDLWIFMGWYHFRAMNCDWSGQIDNYHPIQHRQMSFCLNLVIQTYSFRISVWRVKSPVIVKQVQSFCFHHLWDSECFAPRFLLWWKETSHVFARMIFGSILLTVHVGAISIPKLKWTKGGLKPESAPNFIQSTAKDMDVNALFFQNLQDLSHETNDLRWFEYRPPFHTQVPF